LVDLSIVIVNWNVKDLLERCLTSLTADSRDKGGARVAERGSRPDLECEIIVVDNASSDGSPDMVREQFAYVRLIASNSNLGFARANNRGVAASMGRYILLLNPDTEVRAGALTAMVTYMDEHPDIGTLGPKLLSSDAPSVLHLRSGRLPSRSTSGARDERRPAEAARPAFCAGEEQVQPSRRRFPTLATAFLESTILQQWFPRSRVLQRYYVQDKGDNEEQDTDWLVGACLLIRREAWEQVGPLDENMFMYSEELDWCRRAKAAGWRVVYVPWATVVHHEAQSSNQVVPARHIYFQSSKVYYFCKYHGTVAGETLRLFLLGTYVFQLVLEAAKWAVGHKRALRQQRMAAYMRVLRSGLRVRGEYTLAPTLSQRKQG
jgi:N-acetylglucosaminyl-diphospho-decaprenol L-rhamnosyltransferase